jgi:hypothetical protein
MSFTDWYLGWLEKPPHILPGAKKRQAEKKRKSWFKRALNGKNNWSN